LFSLGTPVSSTNKTHCCDIAEILLKVALKTIILTLNYSLSLQKDWASASNPIGKFAYQSLNQSDFDYFNKSYPYSKHFQLGIGKPNMSANVKPESKIWEMKMTDLFKGEICLKYEQQIYH
jgi:hypothetical protein